MRQPNDPSGALAILAILDQVNLAIRGADDLERMMCEVLSVLVAIFDCDRAFLIQPCDPDAKSWRAAMEQHRHELPSVMRDVERPMDPQMSSAFRLARNTSDAVSYGTAGCVPVPAFLAEQAAVRSMLAVAIHLQFGQPYLLSLNQCSTVRVWTPWEQGLLQGIGGRLADAFGTLAMVRTLRESEAKLEQAQRMTHVGYWNREIDTGTISWSEEASRIFGLPGESRTLPFGELPTWVHPDDRQMVKDRAEAAVRGNSVYDLEYRVIRKNGELRYVHCKGDVVRDPFGNARRLFGTVQDITERRRAEHLAAAQHSITRLLAEAASFDEVAPKLLQSLCEHLVWEAGALWCNDRIADGLRRVATWSHADLEGEAFGLASGDRENNQASILLTRIWSSREAIFLSDVAIQEAERAPGRGDLRGTFGFPIVLAGEVLGVMQFFGREIRPPQRDLVAVATAIGSQMGQFIERKRAQTALHNARVELAHVTRVASLGEITASIAHEVNQPLTAIIANGNAAVRWLTRYPPNLEEALEAVRRVVRDGQRAGQVTARIQALLRKTVEAPKARLDINQLVTETVLLLRSEIQQRRVEARVELATELPQLLGDRVQLQQVILNLILNALEAMSAVAGRSRTLSIRSTDHDPESVLVVVHDTGEGLSSEQMARVFDAFFTTKPHGLGMGLAISRSIIEDHGGQLWVTSEVGVGTTFRFTLPKRC